MKEIHGVNTNLFDYYLISTCSFFYISVKCDTGILTLNLLVIYSFKTTHRPIIRHYNETMEGSSFGVFSTNYFLSKYLL